MLYTYGVLDMLDMWCCVYMVLCAYWICGAIYTWCCGHIGHVVLFTYGVMYMLYMWCYVHDFTCGVVCMWCYVHVALCIDHPCVSM